MKKFLFCLMALLCVMGVSAQSRSMSTTIPTEYQIQANVEIDNQSFTLVPQKAMIQEVDSGHIEFTLYHNHGKAHAILPISYDFTLEVMKDLWDLAYKWKFVSAAEYQSGCQEYNRQKRE